jgi:two-component system, OmpR family, KDP operon response regulator KdpE
LAQKRIALIEDDPDIAYTIRVNLRKEKRYHVEHFASGIAALGAIHERPFDLIVLDLNLPDIDGLALCRELRSQEDTRKIPIIMLTARVEERDKLLGFEIGADDYITKPFGPDELLARLRAVLRRSGDDGTEPAVTIGELVIDTAAHRVTRAGEEIHLTPIEFDLLRVLARHRGKLVTHRQLLHEVWGPGFENETHYLRVHVAHIRAKIERDPSRPRYVVTEPGVGYRLRDE